MDVGVSVSFLQLQQFLAALHHRLHEKMKSFTCSVIIKMHQHFLIDSSLIVTAHKSLSHYEKVQSVYC